MRRCFLKVMLEGFQAQLCRAEYLKDKSFLGFGVASWMLQFIFSEKATTFCEIFTLLLTTVHTYSQKQGEELQNFVAFSEYPNFNIHTHKQASLIVLLEN